MSAVCAIPSRKQQNHWSRKRVRSVKELYWALSQMRFDSTRTGLRSSAETERVRQSIAASGASSRVVKRRVGLMAMHIIVWLPYRLFVVMLAIISKFLLNALPVGESW